MESYLATGGFLINPVIFNLFRSFHIISEFSGIPFQKLLDLLQCLVPCTGSVWVWKWGEKWALSSSQSVSPLKGSPSTSTDNQCINIYYRLKCFASTQHNFFLYFLRPIILNWIIHFWSGMSSFCDVHPGTGSNGLLSCISNVLSCNWETSHCCLTFILHLDCSVCLPVCPRLLEVTLTGSCLHV